MFVVILNVGFSDTDKCMKKLLYVGPSLFLMLFIMPIKANGQQAKATDKKPSPFTVGVAYTGELFGNISGGVNTGVRYLDNIDVDLTVDLESVVGVPDSKLFFYGLGNQGGSISELAGDVQGISNIEAENSWRLYEAWVEQIFPRANTSFLLGLYDLNSEFDVNQTGALFINSSHGIGPEFGISGVLGPSIFPYTSLGGRLKVNPLKGLTLKAAVLDGIPSDPANTEGTNIFIRENDGALLSAEVSYTSGENQLEPSNRHNFLVRGAGPLNQYRFVVGGWLYTRSRAGWIEDDQRDQGLYATVETRLYSEEADAAQGLAGFVRLGLANGKINRFSGYTGAGLVYTGLFNKRSEDQAGMAVAVPWSSPDYQAVVETPNLSPADYEMNVEVTYRFVFSANIQFQLDAQYVINPNTLLNNDNAFLAGTRLLFSL